MIAVCPWRVVGSRLMIESRYSIGSPLDRPVLVLNRLWQAVNVCSTRRAVALLCCGHAEVVDDRDGSVCTYSFGAWCETADSAVAGEVLHSVSLRLPRPRVIVLSVYDRLPRKEVRFSRANVFSRDHHTCQYCRRRFDRQELNIDHVIPRTRGGKTVWTNIVCCCIACNRAKGSRTPDEAGMRLVRPPAKPRWQPFLEVQFARHFDRSWDRFLSSAAWLAADGIS